MPGSTDYHYCFICGEWAYLGSGYVCSPCLAIWRTTQAGRNIPAADALTRVRQQMGWSM